MKSIFGGAGGEDGRGVACGEGERQRGGSDVSAADVSVS
jgi:hypothetical protein